MEGLLHALMLDGQGGATPISDLTQALKDEVPLWLHFDYTNNAVQHFLSQLDFLQEWEWQALLAEETRPRVTRASHGLLLFLRGVNLNPRQNPEDMVSVRCFINKNVLITCRKRVLISIEELHSALLDGQGAQSISDLICALIDRLTHRMQDTLWQVEEQLDEFEEQLDKEECQPDYHQITLLRRQVIALKRYIKPQRQAIYDLIDTKVNFLSLEQRRLLGEANNTLSRYIEELEASIERAQVLQQSITNQLNEQLNQRMYIMSVVAALFLPLGFLTGLLGVNIGGIPGTENPWAFTIFILALVILTIAVGVLFKRRKWI
ncbi:zinc transporter ZntB [Pseudoalteromonas rubra]|uniref:Zinc transporter ZntB n=1 Tax=Pseudoalteromonas rubra TaxID=43658 RepID=A0A5S3UV74_9GAMM|nr:zinc transporter ZntB [Pseudoalteromonas rubra]QPB84399.1 zinc transporter ZntB [Pseudoalteromonas rubra]